MNPDVKVYRENAKIRIEAAMNALNEERYADGYKLLEEAQVAVRELALMNVAEETVKEVIGSEKEHSRLIFPRCIDCNELIALKPLIKKHVDLFDGSILIGRNLTEKESGILSFKYCHSCS